MIPHPIATVAGLSQKKMLPEDFLMKCGLTNHPKGIEFQNADRDGSPARSRLRHAVETSHPTTWLGNESGLKVAFGCDNLNEWVAQKDASLWITESETDALTLRYHGSPAIAIPGASMIQVLRSSDVHGFSSIYIAQQSDAAGKKFACDLTMTLQKFGFSGGVHAVTFGNV